MPFPGRLGGAVAGQKVQEVMHAQFAEIVKDHRSQAGDHADGSEEKAQRPKKYILSRWRKGQFFIFMVISPGENPLSEERSPRMVLVTMSFKKPFKASFLPFISTSVPG